MIYFTSDLHFGHKNVINFDKRPFETTEEMDNFIINNWNKTVSNNDTVYILGDISFHVNIEDIVNNIQQLKGNKILIKGNHDNEYYKKDIFKECFIDIKDYHEFKYNHKLFVLSHYPMLFYNHQHSNGIMCYGHVHNSIEDEYIQYFKEYLKEKDIPCKMINVGIMNNEYRPISIDDLIKKVEEKK
jgi:calcineurin-like phosphoesterase family protein